MRQVIILALILFLSLSPSALTDTGGYTVEKHAPQDGLIDSSGADSTVTFWDIPLWIKMAYISGIVFAFLGSLKIFPMILEGVRRIFRSNALENKNRFRIYNFIKENPGVYFRELISRLKINKGTAEYHLKMLELAGLIASLQNKGYKRYFLNGSKFSNSDQAVLSALREDTPKRILVALIKKPGLSQGEIANVIGISRPAVIWHMKTLTKHGIVKSENLSLVLKYRISSEFLPIVQKYAG